MSSFDKLIISQNYDKMRKSKLSQVQGITYYVIITRLKSQNYDLKLTNSTWEKGHNYDKLCLNYGINKKNYEIQKVHFNGTLSLCQESYTMLKSSAINI